MKGRKFALLAGVEKYEENSGISDLKYATRDAVELATTLRSVCGFDGVSLLLSGDGAAASDVRLATQNALLDELEDLANIIESEDLFVFGFFGHGLGRDGRSYLLPADARLTRSNTFIELKQLEEMLERISARQRIILLDCCRNNPQAGRGEAANTMTDVLARDIGTILAPEAEGNVTEQPVTVRLLACSPGQRAYEWDRVKHGVFAWHVLKAMTAHECWRDGRLTVNAIGEHVQQHMKKWKRGVQTPQYVQTGSARIISLAERLPDASRQTIPPRKRKKQETPPSKVEVQEFNIDPFKIELEPVTIVNTARQDDNPREDTLPPLPPEVHQLRGRKAGLKKVLEQLKQGTHPALQDAREKVQQARRQHDKLKQQRNEAWRQTRRACPHALHDLLLQNPDADLFTLTQYCPDGISMTQCMKLLHLAHNAARAARALQIVQEQFEQSVRNRIKELEDELRQVEKQLGTLLDDYVQKRLQELLRHSADSAAEHVLPMETLLDCIPRLRKVLPEYPEDRIWAKARFVHASLQQQVTPAVSSLTSRMSATLVGMGHRDWVQSVAFSPDGRWLASGSKDRTIKLWEAETGRCIRTLKKHSNRVNSVSFSPDGRWLASGSDDMTIKLWEVETGCCIHTLADGGDWVESVSFSPDGRWLASGGSGNTAIKLWEVKTGRCIRTLKGHSNHVNSVSFSPDGRWLASGSKDRTIKLWEVETGHCIRTLKGGSNHINSVSFSPDGRWLASGSKDRTIKLWEVETGHCIRTLKGHDASLASVSFSPDGRWLASGSWDKTVKLWEVDTGRCVHTLKGHGHRVSSISFSPDGRWLASGSKDRTIKLWEVETGRCICTIKGSRINCDWHVIIGFVIFFLLLVATHLW